MASVNVKETLLKNQLRYFIELSYRGTAYHGWQIQPNAITVQEEISNALSTILRTEIEIVGSGRTDTGVHAAQQFAHFDFEGKIEADLLRRLNGFLPESICIARIFEVAPDAHARFDATSRTYRYLISSTKQPFRPKLCCILYKEVNVELMNEACKILFDYTDFECFSKVHTEVKTFLCDIHFAEWKYEDDLLVFTISANRFLRNMVRAIVGTMLLVGQKKISLDDFREIIESKNRNKAGSSVPAEGLYLTKVAYPYL